MQTDAAIPTFAAKDWHIATGRGRVALTVLDRDTDDFAHLTGQEVLIDGARYRCVAVERHPHGGGWREGEPIGLLVTPLDPTALSVLDASVGRFWSADRDGIIKEGRFA